jgi:hypothetical protein
LVRASDAAVLCVELERTEIKAAKKTLDVVGPDRFIGAIVVSREPNARKRSKG